MIRGLYTSGTGMISQMKKLDIITNNLTNINTNGFKEDTLLTRSFQDTLVSRLNDPSILYSTPEVGPLNKGVRIDQVYTSFEQGTLSETNKPADFAIEGEGFFVVNTPDGERLTRDGAFGVDANGRLITSEGYSVMGENGEIFVKNNQFTLNAEREIISDGEYTDKILVVNADDEALRKIGDNLYVNQNPQSQTVNTDSKVKQGFLEGSNVDLAKSMVNMMEVYRSYESNQKVAKMIDETLERAVNDLGKI